MSALTFLSSFLLLFSGDAAMQAAALASSLGFALVGGAVTGGWKIKNYTINATHDG